MIKTFAGSASHQTVTTDRDKRQIRKGVQTYKKTNTDNDGQSHPSCFLVFLFSLGIFKKDNCPGWKDSIADTSILIVLSPTPISRKVLVSIMYPLC